MCKEKLLLVGAGGFGRVVSETAVLNYDCAFIDDGVGTGTEICGVEVIGNTSDLQTLFGKYKKLVVTIGNNCVRERIYNIAAKIGYEFPNLVHSSTYISPYAKIGWGCVLLNNVIVQNGSSVGNGVLLNAQNMARLFGKMGYHTTFICDAYKGMNKISDETELFNYCYTSKFITIPKISAIE